MDGMSLRAVQVGGLALLALVGWTADGQPEPRPRSTVTKWAAPPAPDASAPVLQRSPDGAIWLAWIQPSGGAGLELRIAELDPNRATWMPSHLIAAVPRFAGGAAAGPVLGAAAGGHLAAAWAEGAGPGRRIEVSFSADGGLDWSEPRTVSFRGRSASAPALTALADGRYLAAWTEPGPGGAGAPAALHSRILAEHSDEPESPFPPAALSPLTLPAIAPFADGGATAAYLGWDSGGTETLRLSRLRLMAWTDPQRLPEGRRTLQTPEAVGPALATDGGREAVAWLAGHGESARVLASLSADAGDQFLMPQRLDDGGPVGRPAVILLHDGAVLVVWLAAPASEEPARLWLRRVTPDFTVDPPTLLASLPADPAGWPTATLLRDYAGGSDSAQVVVAFASPHRHGPSLQTLQVTLPESALLAAANDACHCSPPPAELVGYPIHGTIVGVDLAASVVRVEHDEYPGLLPAGTDRFAVAPGIAAAVKPGTRILGRIERLSGGWRLFALRALVGG
jgi:hypothetical protein